MQLDPELTLEKAIYQARQSEKVRKQQAVVRGQSIVPEAEIKKTIDSISRYERKRAEKEKQNKPTDLHSKPQSCGDIVQNMLSQNALPRMKFATGGRKKGIL